MNRIKQQFKIKGTDDGVLNLGRSADIDLHRLHLKGKCGGVKAIDKVCKYLHPTE